MKNLLSRGVFFTAIAVLMAAVGALAQSAVESGSAQARAPFAHLAVAPRNLNFGLVKAPKTKIIKLRNTGNTAADISVTGPSTSSFSIVSGGSLSAIDPKTPPQEITLQFAPTAAGKATDTITIACSNCNTDSSIVVNLVGKSKGPVGSATPPVPTPTPTPGGSSANALPLTVNQGPFAGAANSAFASITVCATGTSNCTVVNNVLVDTASFGIRIFGSQIAGLSIKPNSHSGKEVGECAYFGSGNTFGAVSTVDVQLAGEPKITLPIQVIDDTGSFASVPGDCSGFGTILGTPQQAGFNGLLGLGQEPNDEPTIFTQYYTCSSGTCTDNNSPMASDTVLNPLPLFPVDNNGVTVSLPAVDGSGAVSVAGTIFLGVGTESNNQPGSVTVYQEDSNINGDNFLGISTTFQNQTFGAFFDTGSNGLFFNDSDIPLCNDNSGFYCPNSTLSESATNKSIGTAASGVVNFNVANEESLSSNDSAFDDLAGTFDGGTSFDGFDWGLPFFFGRTVFLSIDGSSTPIGKGPYTAY